MRTRRIIVNNDLYNIFQVKPPVRDQDIWDAVDKVADSHVDTIALEIPAAHDGSAIDPDLAKLYRKPGGDDCHDNLRTLDGDPTAMIVERAHANGLEIFGSLRVNDTHHKDQLFNPVVSQTYYDNQHHLLEPFSGTRSGTEFDYRKTAVRDHYMGVIRNHLERYDVDGIELNFTRNCRLFPQPYAEECAPILTQWIRELRHLLEQFAKTRQKALALAITIPYTLQGCRQEGLDITTWGRLGLFDILCVCTPFLAEFDRDIHDIRQKLPGIQVYAGCDRNFEWSANGSRVVPMETYRAMALTYLRNGADGVYLLNVMSWTMNHTRRNEAVMLDGGQGETTDDTPVDYDRHLMRELGDIETLEFLDKLYVIAHSDESADRPYASLPVTVPENGEITLRLRVGDDIIRAEREGRLAGIELQIITLDCDDYNAYSLSLNSIALARQYAFTARCLTPDNVALFPEPARSTPVPDARHVCRHAVRPIDLHMGVNFVSIRSFGRTLTVNDVELAIRYTPLPAAT